MLGSLMTWEYIFNLKKKVRRVVSWGIINTSLSDIFKRRFKLENVNTYAGGG